MLWEAVLLILFSRGTGLGVLSKGCGPVKFSFGAGGGDRDIGNRSMPKQGRLILQATSI